MGAGWLSFWLREVTANDDATLVAFALAERGVDDFALVLRDRCCCGAAAGAG